VWVEITQIPLKNERKSLRVFQIRM